MLSVYTEANMGILHTGVGGGGGTYICILRIRIHVTYNVYNILYKLYIYMGQCPAKSGLWGYNFITIKIARYT